MNTYEIIKDLARAKKISIAQLERALDLSNGSISKWVTAKPNSEPLTKIADYFNVSVDYLLGRDEQQTGQPPNEPESMAKQVMFRMDTAGLSPDEIDELEKEMERFFRFRKEEIERERNEKA